MNLLVVPFHWSRGQPRAYRPGACHPAPDRCVRGSDHGKHFRQRAHTLGPAAAFYLCRSDSGWPNHDANFHAAEDVAGDGIVSLVHCFFARASTLRSPSGAFRGRPSGLELSDDYNDRTRIQIWRMVFAALAGFGLAWIHKLCFVFNADEVIGVRYVVWIVGGIMTLTGKRGQL